MRSLHPAVSALLLGLLASGAAWSQSAVAPGATQPGSLPPPRPLQAPAAPPAQSPFTPPAATPSQPRPQQPPAAQPAPRPAQPQGQAQRPAAQPGTTPPRPPAQATPAQPRPQGQGQAQGQTQGRPAGQAPTVNRPQQPNRRPAAAAAAGAAAGAAAAGAAAAANRAPEPAAPPQPAPPPVPSVGSVTGLALPRFAALRSDEVNMRVGPNTTFPIEWTFQRRDLPVQIVGEFQLWRRIRDVDGAEGWVHSSTLAGRRTVLVRPANNAPEAALRRRPEEGAGAVAQLRAGVIARIRECEAGAAWCEVQVAGHRGYLRRTEVWGVGPEEEVK